MSKFELIKELSEIASRYPAQSKFEIKKLGEEKRFEFEDKIVHYRYILTVDMDIVEELNNNVMIEQYIRLGRMLKEANEYNVILPDGMYRTLHNIEFSEQEKFFNDLEKIIKEGRWIFYSNKWNKENRGSNSQRTIPM